MTHFIVLVLALLIGAVAGLRALTAPAVMAWAAALHWINLDGTWAHWLSHPATVTVLTVLAVGELITDQLPSTPARTVPVQFGTRILLGGFSGAVLGTAWNFTWTSLGAGIIGAVIGTLVGFQLRRRLVAANGGHDLPIALLEDSVAVLGGLAIAALTAVV
ncbi:DUF4126 domain-containing protein [Mycolicibacter minnesotensis]|uniref:DUF4126 domain-containing protein n=1 Tax=Mycolicibacter minnesotensis TaxID=1118379 RepID=A0A7I7R9H9_9MYCO|nr:DUF4126 family protein [Mycolicibacter minnesotensis]ORB01396.1 DUF4126 domain-containing protein [Mycolicibacter minnesotensis]BBY35344.1 membrane protein [Mycolicibacter minnesotensis]